MHSTMVTLVTHALLLTYIILYVGAARFPSYVTPCRRDDPKIEACILKQVEVLKPHLPGGVRQMAIPPLEPLVIPMVRLASGEFQLSFWNSSIYRLTDFTVDALKLSLRQNRLTMRLSFPEVKYDCTYEVKGKILILHLNGKGPGKGDYRNVKVDVDFKFERYQKKSKEHWKIKKNAVRAMLGKPVFVFENLFGNNKELNDHTLEFINANVDEFIKDLQPAINQVIGDVIVNIMGRLLNRFSLNEMFP